MFPLQKSRNFKGNTFAVVVIFVPFKADYWAGVTAEVWPDAGAYARFPASVDKTIAEPIAWRIPVIASLLGVGRLCRHFLTCDQVKFLFSSWSKMHSILARHAGLSSAEHMRSL